MGQITGCAAVGIGCVEIGTRIEKELDKGRTVVVAGLMDDDATGDVGVGPGIEK